MQISARVDHSFGLLVAAPRRLAKPALRHDRVALPQPAAVGGRMTRAAHASGRAAGVLGIVLAIGCGFGNIADLAPERRLAKADAELAAAKGEYARWVSLDAAALLNAEAGSAEKAKAYADESLSLAPRYARDWNYGNAIHKSHIAYGLLALREGDVRRAGEELVSAGDTPGSPQLDSFGPNMVLARRLAEKGERDAVVRYLDRCRKFWSMDRGRLDSWKSQIAAGVVPDFGANVYY
ncbi:MAG TPA: hypothetical protein VH854_00675 [Thermoanaerobaculia bacterium]|jgi:hypothetical protein|nr:hypothetical protein [Thermoanaerobaculia bacterium]